MPWLLGAAAKRSSDLCMAYDPGDIRQLWAQLCLRTGCSTLCSRSAALNSWLAAAVFLRAEASYGLRSIRCRAARRRLAAAFTAGVNQFLVMPVTIVRLPSSAVALSVNMSMTADAIRLTPRWSLWSVTRIASADCARARKLVRFTCLLLV